MLFPYTAFLAVLSMFAGILYAADKHRAVRGTWRISEKALLAVGFFGGASGALLAMRLCRHKTRHLSFWIVNTLGFLWQAGLLLYLIFAPA